MNQFVLTIGGIVLLFTAGWFLDAMTGRRKRREGLDEAAARARRAIRLAEASRDASAVHSAVAEQQLARAQSLMSGVSNAKTARRAAALAERADKVWQSKRNLARIADGSSGSTSTSGGRSAASAGPKTTMDRPEVVKTVSVLLLALIALVFISQQTQQPNTVFKPREAQAADESDTDDPGSSIPRQPSFAQVRAQYGDDPIIAMDGATAVLDTDVVLEWMATANEKAQAEADPSEGRRLEVKHIVLAPPMHPDAEDPIDVPDNVLLVTGTRAALSPMVSEPSDVVSMELSYAASDVTSAVVALIANRVDEEPPEDVPMTWRAPTDQELADVLADLEQEGIAFVGGVEPFSTPQQAYEAFPDEEPLVIVAGRTAQGEPAVNYADAVAEAMPGRPVVGMTGVWLDFAGLHAAEFEDPMRASLYGQYARRIQQFDYSQQTVLSLGLDRVAQFRHSGMFAQPLPYQAPDPIKLTLPALPWICAALGLVALVASVVQIRRQQGAKHDPVDEQTLHRMAGLSELAVEVSGLTDEASRPAQLRALRALAEAKDVADNVSEDPSVVHDLIERAERELTSIAVRLERPEYRPDTFLAGRWT